jgi:CRISPR-associated endoribonuclease Cas6
MDDQQRDMLYSIVLILTPIHETTIGATMGDQVHAAFLHTVRESDPALAEVLHMPAGKVRGRQVQPFTVSPLRGVPQARGRQVMLSPGQDYWLRFTVLYPPIFECFMARFLRGQGRPVIRLGRAVLLIKEIRTTPGSHPWAGYASWGQLAGEARPVEQVRLAFTSPTAFGFGRREWGNKVVVLPRPELVFGSLIRSWNTLAPPPLAIDRQALLAYVEEHVVVKRIAGLETRMQHFRRALQVGYIGRVTYGLMADDEVARCQLDALAQLTFYTGVGMKTTMGMGQVRRVVE